MEDKNLKVAGMLAIISLSLVSPPAFAYVGPGTGLSAIGALLALVAALIVGILGFLWYPIKRLMGKKKNPTQIEKLSETKSFEAEESTGDEEMFAEPEDSQK